MGEGAFMPILQTKKLHSERLSMLAQDTQEWALGHELEGIYVQAWLLALAWPERGGGDASLRSVIPGAKRF